MAYRGDTVEQALLENSIVLKEEDQVSPSRDTVIDSDTQVQLRRSCQVTVTAQGKSQQVTSTGGTVADA